MHGSVLIAGSPVTLTFIVWLNFVAAFLLAGLVYSVTYFSTVLLKHAKGIIYGAGVLVGYIFLEQVVPHYWPGIHLPKLVLQEFIQSNRDVTGISDHLGFRWPSVPRLSCSFRWRPNSYCRRQTSIDWRRLIQ